MTVHEVPDVAAQVAAEATLLLTTSIRAGDYLASPMAARMNREYIQAASRLGLEKAALTSPCCIDEPCAASVGVADAVINGATGLTDRYLAFASTLLDRLVNVTGIEPEVLMAQLQAEGGGDRG